MKNRFESQYSTNLTLKPLSTATSITELSTLVKRWRYIDLLEMFINNIVVVFHINYLYDYT